MGVHVIAESSTAGQSTKTPTSYVLDNVLSHLELIAYVTSKEGRNSS